MGTYDRKRVGFLAFLRPRFTVSPVSQQPPHELHSAFQPKSASHQAVQLPNSPNIASSDWSNLPEHLIESILTMLHGEDSDALHRENQLARLTIFSATSVSKNWRHTGKRAFFQSLWDVPSSIRHPVQLFGLSPGSPNHLMKCVMKREFDSNRPGAVKYTLRLGEKFHNSTFLMTALQISRLDIKIYLSSKCSGTPCAKIQTNLLGTKYEAILDDTVQPFIQRECTHRHESGCYHSVPAAHNAMTHSTFDSAGDLLLSRDQSWFDVPMLDSSLQRPLSSKAIPLDLLDTNASLELAPAFSDSVLKTQDASSVLRTQEMIPEGQAAAASPHTPRQSSESAGSESGNGRQRSRGGRQDPASPQGLQGGFSGMQGGSPLANSSRRGRPDPGNPQGLQGGIPGVQGGSGRACSSSFLSRCKSGLEGTALSIMDSMNFSGLLRSEAPMQSPFAAVPGSFSQEGPSTPCSCETVPSSIGSVQYKTRIRGFMRPRRMKVALPDPSALACFDTTGLHRCCSTPGPSGRAPLLQSTSLVAQDFPGTQVSQGDIGSSAQAAMAPATPPQPGQSSQPLASSRSSSLWTGTSASTAMQDSPSPSKAPPQTPSVVLRNKPPHWNDTLRCWCLNFRGRVKLASVKNFQLVKANDSSKSIVMQFGKVDGCTYIMDYNPSEITALQAFAISLSTFDTKLLL